MSEETDDREEEEEIAQLLANIKNGKFKPYFEHTDCGGPPLYVICSEEKIAFWLHAFKTKLELQKFCKQKDIKLGDIFCSIPDCPKHRR